MANPFGSILPALKSTGGEAPDMSAKRTATLSIAPKMASYKKGTSFVRRTGPAKLEKGEAVLNVRQARKYRKAKMHSASSALGAGKKKVPMTKTERLTKAAGDEMKRKPPAILRKTLRKSGPKRAEAQRVAILLSKARAAGADIPEKK